MSIDMTDRPFGCPPDIVLDIPIPPSVNKARKIHWASHREVQSWQKRTDILLIATKQCRGQKKVQGRYELHILIDEAQTRCDLPNLEKLTTDYLVSREILKDDAPAYLRKLVMEWTDSERAPNGLRVIVKPIEGA